MTYTRVYTRLRIQLAIHVAGDAHFAARLMVDPSSLPITVSFHARVPLMPSLFRAPAYFSRNAPHGFANRGRGEGGDEKGFSMDRILAFFLCSLVREMRFGSSWNIGHWREGNQLRIGSNEVIIYIYINI